MVKGGKQKGEWSKEVNKGNSKVDPFNKFPEFMTFLLEQKRIIEYEMTILRVSTMPKNNYGVVNYGKIENSVGGENVISKWCIFHKTDSHKTDECSSYTSKNPSERMALLKDCIACWSCLKTGYRLHNCWYQKVCGVNGCSSYHHASLHVPLEKANLAQLLGSVDSSTMCLLPVMKVKSVGTDLNVH